MPNYVPITPKLAPSSSDAGFTSSEVLESKRRRIGVSIACNVCRRKKIRCNGQRPACSACENTGRDCVYRDDSGISEESQSLLLEVIRLLNSLPDDKVLDKVKNLKNELDCSAILSSLRGGLTEQPSDSAVDMAMMSDELQSLELGPHYPNAYPATPVLSLQTLEEATYQQLIQAAGRSSDTDIVGEIISTEAEGAQVLRDDRLSRVNISQWTNVAISNESAARIVSFYLETDHPLLGFFDANLFVSDFITGKRDYCSPFLVNALLYWACQLNSARDPDSGSLALDFCSEAESLWEHQRNNDSILNLAAIQFLSLGYLGQGRDHAVLTYVNEASQMATRMGFFGIANNHQQQEIIRMPEPVKSAYLYAAWGSFNWIIHMSLFYRQPGLLCPKIPPKLPIPGNEPVNGTEESSNSDNSQPESDPEYMGGVFPYICQFWTILHELALMYRLKGPFTGDRRTLSFAEFKFRELLAWSNRLPPKLSRDDKSPHCVQILHIWLHAAILDLFRFSMASGIKNQHLRTFTSLQCTPENVCTASARQLKHLILNYRLNFDSSSHTILWHTALTYLANAMLHPPKDETWLFYFLLCIYGYERLRPSWRVTQAISTALLSMALRKGDITSPTARQLLRDINNANGSSHLPGEVNASFMADLDLAASDPGSATVEKMAQEFEQNLLLQQYTNVFEEPL